MSVNAATREHGINYSLMVHGLKNADVELNRKVLSELAQTEPYAFKSITLLAKSQVKPEWLERRNKREMEKLYNVRKVKSDELDSDIPQYTTMQEILRY